MFGFLNQEEEGSFSRTERWGTLSDNEWNASPLSAAEREALIRLPRPLPLDGPRIHQPRPDSSGDIRLRSDSCQDPYVHNGIKLLAHMRKSQDGTKQPPISLGDLTFFKTQSEPPFGVKSLCSHLHSEKTSFAEGKYPDSTAHKFKLTSRSTRQMLHKSVATICAFVGYETASLGALDLLTDVVAEYLRTFTKLLRDSRDRECLYEQSMGFPDSLERICYDMNIGSVLQIQRYYEDSVIKYYKNILKEWKKRKTASSSSSTTILVGSNSAEIILGEDDIPEIHFPSGEECTGDHATPQYETGLQVLQSLEQAGVMIPNEDPVESIGLSPGNNRKRRRTEDQKTI
ncbi:STAGA complex 65 subunit gamma [Lepeophtheirus salmonis]|uniref:Suppressor of Ty 7like [Xenopus laevis] n=1 Tax=Lepeophtheirus salmonis TaxID=72036 RepID=A0A0K2UXA2_LEPSM|nr:uncharacterized protein LOC121113754 [Lepeophtheirus salmonis]